MSSDTSSPAIGALVLVPIVIAASAAYIAIKTSETADRLGRYCSKLWNNRFLWFQAQQTQRRRKLRRSNLPSTQLYADSWCDLESGDDDTRYTPFLGQERRSKSYSEGDKDNIGIQLENPKQIWHPSRSTRLLWSFTNPRSLSPLRLGSSSAARPLQAARLPERLSEPDAKVPIAPLFKAREVHRWESTDR